MAKHEGNLNIRPDCVGKSDCFAYVSSGKCGCLRDTKFSSKRKGCPFYKTYDEYISDREKYGGLKHEGK